LFDSHLYGPPDLYEDSPPSELLEDIAMSQTSCHVFSRALTTCSFLFSSDISIFFLDF
jgi:hypothetical protein